MHNSKFFISGGSRPVAMCSVTSRFVRELYVTAGGQLKLGNAVGTSFSTGVDSHGFGATVQYTRRLPSGLVRCRTNPRTSLKYIARDVKMPRSTSPSSYIPNTADLCSLQARKSNALIVFLRIHSRVIGCHRLAGPPGRQKGRRHQAAR